MLPQDSFGYPVALSNETTIVGAPFSKRGTNTFQGSAYIFASDDIDGDALPDEWEIKGITVNVSGAVVGTGNLVGQGTFINLPAMGADPKHKDIFIQADWMRPGPTGKVLKASARVIKMVSDAFAVGKVENPDGKKGIRLHVDLGPDSIMNPVTKAKWNTLSRAVELPFQAVLGTDDPETGEYDFAAFDAIKERSFGVTGRRPAFHYCLFASAIPDKKSGGIAPHVLSADFMIMYGDAFKFSDGTPRVPSLVEKAYAFMHELGHNLGLDHGGDEELNFKPNYISIMNYAFGAAGLLSKNVRQRKLDYSRSELPSLNERSLNESAGISDPAGRLTLWRTRPTTPASLNKCVTNQNNYYKIFLPGPALDWNCDGLKTPGTVQAIMATEPA